MNKFYKNVSFLTKNTIKGSISTKIFFSDYTLDNSYFLETAFNILLSIHSDIVLEQGKVSDAFHLVEINCDALPQFLEDGKIDINKRDRLIEFKNFLLNNRIELGFVRLVFWFDADSQTLELRKSSPVNFVLTNAVVTRFDDLF